MYPQEYHSYRVQIPIRIFLFTIGKCRVILNQRNSPSAIVWLGEIFLRRGNEEDADAFFNTRIQLLNYFYEWCEDNDVPESAFSLISFLEAKNLIDVDKTIEYLQGEYDE